jgi:hypothetical protein
MSETEMQPLFEISRKDGGEPCGECHLQAGETCDICGARERRTDATVPMSVYESAVRGRQDFRAALRRARSEHLEGYVVHAALLVAKEAAGTYAALAGAVGVSDEYVRSACLGTRPVTGKLLAFLGFERVIAYRRPLPTPPSTVVPGAGK